MTLWTPGGERKIENKNTPPSQEQSTEISDPNLSPEQKAQAEEMAKQLSEARAQLLETGVGTVLANHALGIYELAAIHLTADEPNMQEAKLAIDALGLLVEGLEGKLGDAEPTIKDALHQIRLGYIQREKENPTEKPSE